MHNMYMGCSSSRQSEPVGSGDVLLQDTTPAAEGTEAEKVVEGTEAAEEEEAGAEPAYPINDAGHASVPEGATALEVMAFYNCPLVSISMPPTISEIGMSAFTNCTSLKELTP
jgi:hypothetical protein